MRSADILYRVNHPEPKISPLSVTILCRKMSEREIEKYRQTMRSNSVSQSLVTIFRALGSIESTCNRYKDNFTPILSIRVIVRSTRDVKNMKKEENYRRSCEQEDRSNRKRIHNSVVRPKKFCKRVKTRGIFTHRDSWRARSENTCCETLPP